MIKFHPSKIFFFPLLFLALFLSGQNRSIGDRVKPAFKNYFAFPSPSIYLHLNKTELVQGEHLWFKAYVYDRLKGVPFDQTLNLYLGIYNNKGEQLHKKLLSSADGYTLGQIKIDSTFTSGTHYIKAYTKGTDGIKEKDHYVQKFGVHENQTDKQSNLTKLAYDAQFLPEGGHLISDVQSTVGVKIIDQYGYGVSGAKGVVKNNAGQTIAGFETNAFGLAKISFIPEFGLNYFAEVSFFEGERNTFLLPQVEHSGIGLTVQHLENNKLALFLGTNAVTKEKIDDFPMSVVIHRDGLMKKLDLKFSGEAFYVSFVLDKKDLFHGINIITLIDNKGVPIAERLVFNYDKLTIPEPEITVSKISQDTISIAVNMPKSVEGLSNLSISVLPSATKAYNQRNNSLSSFLLKPYLKGFVQNPSYYFKNITLKKQEELDLLLLTQGWSSYDWGVIFSSPQERERSLARGVKLTGRLSSKLKKSEQLLYYSNKGALPSVITLADGTSEFKLYDFFPLNGSEIQFSIIRDKGTFTRPIMSLTIDNQINTDRVYNIWSDDLSPFRNTDLKDADLPSPISGDKTIRLDEVTVTESRKTKRFSTPQIFQNKIREVSPELERAYPSLLDLIRSNGYNVAIDPNGDTWNPIQISTRRPLVFSEVQPSPIIYINDIRQHDFQFLLDFPMTKIESFFIDRTGAGEHGGAGGVIRVYTRDEGNVGAGFKIKSRKVQKKFFKHIVTNGFEPAKRFYAPKYVNTENESFENFGVIHWEPLLLLNAKEKVLFKIPNTGIKNISFFIEGMSENGTLFSSEQRLNITSDQ